MEESISSAMRELERMTGTSLGIDTMQSKEEGVSGLKTYQKHLITQGAVHHYQNDPLADEQFWKADKDTK